MGLVQGVGINDSEGRVVLRKKQEDGSYIVLWRCPFYRAWADMLKRCYGKNKPNSYVNAVVCAEWLLFSNFKLWMGTQDHDGKHLDKDLLLSGNKIYSPETCIFVTEEVNHFLTEVKSRKSELPTGVNLDSYTSMYKATIRRDKRTITLGRFYCPEEAHLVWLREKLKYAKELASRQTDLRVAEALIRRYENYSEESKQ